MINKISQHNLYHAQTKRSPQPTAQSYDKIKEQQSENGERFINAKRRPENIDSFVNANRQPESRNRITDNRQQPKNRDSFISNEQPALRTCRAGRVTYILADENKNKSVDELPPEMSVLRRLTEKAGGYTVCSCKGGDSFSYAIKTGKKSVITIDSRFVAAIADKPELIKHYADEIENMSRLDKQFERQAKRMGKKIVSRGWHIDKDGGISSWSVVKTESKAKKGVLEQMNELRRNINKKKRKKQKEQQRLEELRSRRKEELLRLEGRKKAAMREKLGRKAKKARIYDFNELIIKRPPQKVQSVSISSGYTPPIVNLNTKA